VPVTLAHSSAEHCSHLRPSASRLRYCKGRLDLPPRLRILENVEGQAKQPKITVFGAEEGGKDTQPEPATTATLQPPPCPIRRGDKRPRLRSADVLVISKLVRNYALDERIKEEGLSDTLKGLVIGTVVEVVVQGS
jgi:hypothetical protein